MYLEFESPKSNADPFWALLLYNLAEHCAILLITDSLTMLFYSIILNIWVRVA